MVKTKQETQSSHDTADATLLYNYCIEYAEKHINVGYSFTNSMRLLRTEIHKKYKIHVPYSFIQSAIIYGLLHEFIPVNKTLYFTVEAEPIAAENNYYFSRDFCVKQNAIDYDII